jgi:hypothetical protein
MYKIGDVVIPSVGAWVHPITHYKYPANWIAQASDIDRALVGLFWCPDPVPPAPQPLPIAEVKARKTYAIDSKTEQLISSGFVYKNKSFSMSQAAQHNWGIIGTGLALGLITGANLPKVSTVDGLTYVFANLDDVYGFLATYSSFLTSPTGALALGRALKAQVAAANTIEQVNAIVDNR